MKKSKIELFKRLRIIGMLTVLLFVVLSIRMAILTIAKGDYYREISDNMRIKDIYVTASRGEIRDRNGVLLAGNKPMFTLQILKDEFENKKKDEKNSAILKAITLLEQDAINYNHDFPISLNNYYYEDISDNFKTELSPNDRVIEIIIQNNLVGEIVDSYYENKSEINDFYYFPAENFINSLEYNSVEVPIDYYLENGKLNFYFKEVEDIENWRRNYNISNDLDARGALISLINNNETLLKKLLAHPINRKLVYDILQNRGLTENIRMEELSNKYHNDYINTKISLMSVYDDITMETTAKQDFATLFVKNSINNFMKFKVEDGGINIVDILKDLYSKNNIEIFFDAKIENNIPVYFEIGDEGVNENFVIEKIVKTLIDNNLVEKLIDYPDVLYYMQQQLINDGIVTNISISDGIEYTSIKNLNNFYEKYKITEEMSKDEKLKKILSYYDISDKLSIYEISGILDVYKEIEQSSNTAYLPINFSYGLKDKTVAKIEEQLSYFDGFNISVEPVRYYPYGESTAHILGYMGKISQESEIEKYINKNNYNPDTLIGKTGIEQSFEDNLHGTNGYKKVEVDNLGNPSNTIEEIKPKSGDNIYLSIDYKVQRRAEYALKNILEKIRTGGIVESEWGNFNVVKSKEKGAYDNATSGAVVAVDVKTGEILALASYPAYDPNLFSTGISSADWDGLMPKHPEDPLAPRPLYNVATQTSVQPGSTFKMVTALAALEKGLSPETEIEDMGYIEIGDTRFGCWLWNQQGETHGSENMSDAIRDSCNYYFYTLALGENQRTGAKLNMKLEIEDISEMAKTLGLGSDTGLEINIPKETESGVPDPNAKTNLTKISLNNWLVNNIDRFYVGDIKFNDTIKENTINEILSWADKDEPMSLKEVYSGLNSLKLDGTMKVGENSRDTLADIIKFTFLNNAKWTLADTINITIGQGANSYTLTQMTNYISTICNGGYKNKMTLINNIKNNDNSTIEYQNEPIRERIKIKDYDYLNPLKLGMRQAAVSGYNKDVFKDFPVEVALKTGTAERSGINPVTKETYDSFAYEVAFAPYDDPRIAVGVVIFQGGSGPNCSPIVREVIAEYMGLYRQKEIDNLPIEMNIVP